MRLSSQALVLQLFLLQTTDACSQQHQASERPQRTLLCFFPGILPAHYHSCPVPPADSTPSSQACSAVGESTGFSPVSDSSPLGRAHKAQTAQRHTPSHLHHRPSGCAPGLGRAPSSGGRPASGSPWVPPGQQLPSRWWPWPEASPGSRPPPSSSSGTLVGSRSSLSTQGQKPCELQGLRLGKQVSSLQGLQRKGQGR